jgi:hypothetical protein
MNDLVARTIIKNKYWVVEQSGNQIATIQAVENGGFVYVHDDRRETYSNVKNIKSKYNIRFAPNDQSGAKENQKEVHGFPATSRTYNEVYDIKHKVAIYTKLPKSRSHYCAGWYLIKSSNKWSKVFCPKTIVIKRYEYRGPFKTEQDMLEKLKQL